MVVVFLPQYRNNGNADPACGTGPVSCVYRWRVVKFDVFQGQINLKIQVVRHKSPKMEYK